MNAKTLFYAITLSVFCTTANAADFTFNVPVRVENVPSMTSLSVSCYVSIVPLGGPSAAGGTNVVGRGSTSITPVNGRYNGTVRVEVNATGINPAASGQSYNCSLRGNGRALTGAMYAAQSGNFRRVYETATGHTLDRLTVSTRGAL